jgi:hypothetical protein
MNMRQLEAQCDVLDAEIAAIYAQYRGTSMPAEKWAVVEHKRTQIVLLARQWAARAEEKAANRKRGVR